MTRAWIPRVGEFTASALLVGSLVFLQALNAEKELLSCLSAYGIIALASLLSLAVGTKHSAAALHCHQATAIFIGYVVIRALTSPSPYSARADLYCALAAVTVYLLTSILLASSKKRLGLVLALLVFGIIHVLVSVIQAGFGENLLVVSSLEIVERGSRGTGLYVNPDHLAGLLEVLGILGLSLACWSRLPGWSKAIVAYLTAVAYLGLVLTGSRGGYLSAATSLALFALLSLIVLRAGGTALLAKTGGMGLLLLIASVTAVWFTLQQSPPLKAAAERIFTVDAGRIDLWRAAIKQWRLQPLFGTGSGTYLFYGRQFRSEQMQTDPIDVHNDYLQLLCEYGLIGAVGFLVFFFLHLRQGWQSFLRLGPRRVAAGSILQSDRLALNIGALCAIATYVVHSSVDFNLHIPANALLLAFVFGLIANSGLSQPSVRSTRPTFSKFVLLSLGIFLLVQSVRLLPGEYFSEKARAALRDDEPAAAIAFAEKALTYEQANPHIYHRLGRARIAFANRDEQAETRTLLYEQAIPAFEAARQLVPLDGTYAQEVGFLFDRLGRFPEAEAMYKLALARDPLSRSVQARYQAHQELRAAKENAGTQD